MKYLLVILLFLTWYTPVSTQQIVEVVHIEKDDGLKDRTVDRVIRDKNGYFLLFMLNTIQRYDGKTFETIDISALKSNRLQVRDIEKIDLLSDGTINLYIPNSNILFSIPNKLNRVSASPLKGQPIANQGNLYLLKPSGMKSKRYLLHQIDLSTNSVSDALSKVELTDEVEEIAIINNLIYLQKCDLSIHLIKENDLSSFSIKGKLIQRENGIYVFGQSQIHKLLDDKSEVVANFDTSYSTCNILKLDAQENIIASYSNRVRFQDRIYVLDNSDSIHIMDNLLGLTDVFKDFHTDDAFYRWMLGGYDGIHIVNLLRDGAEIIYKRENIKKGKFGVVISGVATNAKDSVIFTRESEGLFSYDKENKSYTEHMKKVSQSDDYVRNAKIYYHEASDQYFSHTYRYDGKSNIYKTDLETKTFKKFVIPYKLNDIYVLNDSILLFGGYVTKTNQGILGGYNIKNRIYHVIRDDTREVRSITFDEQTQTYWVGTYAGLYVMDVDFNTLALFNREKANDNFIAQDHIIMTSRYKNWMIAASYGGGINVIDPLKYEIVKKIDESNGLNDNSAIGVINDNLGNCWITTFNGITVIDKNLKVIRKIYEHEGLPNREFNSKAIAKDNEGNIFSGTLNGVSMLNPKKVLQWQKTNKLDIQSIIGYKGKNFERLEVAPEIPLFESYDSLVLIYNLPDYHHYPYVRELINLEVGGNIEYSISKDQIILKNIKAGEYELNFSLDGQVEEINLKIKRHSNLRRTISIFFIAIGIGLFAWLTSRQIIKNNKIREKEKTKLNKRIADLQLSSLQSQMNPHFIFNALGSIQYFIQTYDTVKADEFLTNFAMLMRSILESSKSKYITLKEEIKLLNLYIGLEKIRFENLFDYEIEIDDALDFEDKIPPMILQPFVENAINHGLYHLKGRKGKLLLTFEATSSSEMKITVSDNGIGRKAATKLRSKNHKSRGMQIVNERLQTINQSQDLKVNVATKDLDQDGIPSGTHVVITISELN